MAPIFYYIFFSTNKQYYQPFPTVRKSILKNNINEVATCFTNSIFIYIMLQK